MVPAPGRFSITTDWPPQRAERKSARMRATTSVGPPAANGTRSFTGREGKSAALCAAAPVAAASNTRAVAIVRIAFIACRRCPRILEHDPEKWIPVFGKDHAPAISETAVAHPTGVAASKKEPRREPGQGAGG